jgi:hypothetical protein
MLGIHLGDPGLEVAVPGEDLDRVEHGLSVFLARLPGAPRVGARRMHHFIT